MRKYWVTMVRCLGEGWGQGPGVVREQEEGVGSEASLTHLGR